MIPLTDRAGWQAALNRIPHAFAHTWESCHAMHLTTGLPTFLFVWEGPAGRVVCPISERTFAGTVDAVTPYGFGGFCGAGEGEEFLIAWRAIARERDWICAYVGLNPLFAPAVCSRQANYHAHNDVYVLDLRQSEEELYAGLSQVRRRQLRKSKDSGDGLVDSRAALEDFFLREVAGFLKAKGAGPVYAFSEATWRALFALDNIVLLGAVGETGGVEAVMMFAHTRHCAEYLFGVSTPQGRASSVPLLWRAALLLRSLGCARFNLGGGVTKDDSLAEFKRLFGAQRLPLGALRQIHDLEGYARLCAQAGHGPEIATTGYFPSYRQAAAGIRTEHQH